MKNEGLSKTPHRAAHSLSENMSTKHSVYAIQTLRGSLLVAKTFLADPLKVRHAHLDGPSYGLRGRPEEGR